MLKRIWHALVVGHTWQSIRRDSAHGTNSVRYYGIRNEIDRYEVYGFTTNYYSCSCGASKQFRSVGVPQVDAKAETELDQLRKMAGLEP